MTTILVSDECSIPLFVIVAPEKVTNKQVIHSIRLMFKSNFDKVVKPELHIHPENFGFQAHLPDYPTKGNTYKLNLTYITNIKIDVS